MHQLGIYSPAHVDKSAKQWDWIFECTRSERTQDRRNGEGGHVKHAASLLAKNARNPAAFGFVRVFPRAGSSALQSRFPYAHWLRFIPGILPYPDRQRHPDLRPLPPRRSMRHLPVTPSDFRDTVRQMGWRIRLHSPTTPGRDRGSLSACARVRNAVQVQKVTTPDQA
jgi:hypothetical protein